MPKLTALLLAALAFLLCSCAARDERAQHAANARAGVQAAAQVLADQLPKLDAAVAASVRAVLEILEGVNGRLPAASGVPSSEWPAPAMTPKEILKDPTKYNGTRPPEPQPSGFPWGVLSAAGLGLLYVVGRVAPMVPALGPLAGMVANTAWQVLSTSHQKDTDAVHAGVAAAASAAAPVLDVLRQVDPASLPAGLRDQLTPERWAAIAAILAALRAPEAPPVPAAPPAAA